MNVPSLRSNYWIHRFLIVRSCLFSSFVLWTLSVQTFGSLLGRCVIRSANKCVQCCHAKMKPSLGHKYFLVSARTKFGRSLKPTHTHVSHPCLLCPSTCPQWSHTYRSFPSLYNSPWKRSPRLHGTDRCKGCLNYARRNRGLSYYADSMARSKSNATTIVQPTGPHGSHQEAQ